jgi:hypothetical protein
MISDFKLLILSLKFGLQSSVLFPILVHMVHLTDASQAIQVFQEEVKFVQLLMVAFQWLMPVESQFN